MVWCFLRILNIESLCDPALPLLHTHAKEIESRFSKRYSFTCVHRNITTTKSKGNPGVPSGQGMEWPLGRRLFSLVGRGV